MIDVSTTDGTGHVLSQNDIGALEYENLRKIRCCANCVYWDVYEDSSFNGDYELKEAECHRNPPMVPNVYSTTNWDKDNAEIDSMSVELIRGTPLMSHPFTYGCDWCGEFSNLPKLRIEDLGEE